MTLSINRRAALWGNRTAVVDDGGTDHGYEDLAEQAALTARRLAARGIGEGDAVAVCSRNRIEHLHLLFACRRLGATLAPISHRLGTDAVASLGGRIDPALVVHEARFEELAAVAAGGASGEDQSEGPGGPLTVEAFAQVEPVSPGHDALGGGSDRRDATDESPLLYLHTGGTTGVPKVVAVSHRQVEWNCVTEAAAWGLGADDVAPIVLPLYHTGGWLLLTLPLLYVGGRIVLRREFDPGRTLAAIEEHRATRVFAVAAVFEAMAEHDAFSERDLSSVEWFMSGGGPTPTVVIEAYREQGATFVQGYGLTEGGPNDLYFPPDRAGEAKATESVGRPFPDCEARLVDTESGDPLDGGRVDAGVGTGDAGGDGAVTGELELRGPVTARRYLATEDGTFEGGPASEASGAPESPQFSGEWVSTGDLARRDPEGDYTIVGRTDNMFVSGGENVYPEEIEDALARHPDVAAVGVVGIHHERWGTVPRAVIVPADDRRGSDAAATGRHDGEVERDDGAGIDRGDLEALARERLADFKVPAEWTVADELPRSGPGKLDREALARTYGERPADGEASRTDRGGSGVGSDGQGRDGGGDS